MKCCVFEDALCVSKYSAFRCAESSMQVQKNEISADSPMKSKISSANRALMDVQNNAEYRLSSLLCTAQKALDLVWEDDKMGSVALHNPSSACPFVRRIR